MTNFNAFATGLPIYNLQKRKILLYTTFYPEKSHDWELFQAFQADVQMGRWPSIFNTYLSGLRKSMSSENGKYMCLEFLPESNFPSCLSWLDSEHYQLKDSHVNGCWHTYWSTAGSPIPGPGISCPHWASSYRKGSQLSLVLAEWYCLQARFPCLYG